MSSKIFNNTKINVEFDEDYQSRININSGENISSLFAKIRRFILDLKSVAFSGSYNDLSDTPDVVTKEYVDPIKSQAALNKSTLGTQCKNLLKNTATTKTVSGITFTVNTDGSVTVNGTNTSSVSAYIQLCGLVDYGDGKLTASIGQNVVDVYMAIYDSNWDWIGTGSVGTISWENNGKKRLVRLVVKAGATINNITIYPMIRDADITDDTYEPYSDNVDTRIIKNKSDIAVTKSTLGYQCKNLFDLRNYASKYTAGVTATPNGVDGLTFSGTANNTFYLAWNEKTFSLKKGGYILSYAGDITSDNPNNTFLRVRKSDNTIICDLPLSQTSKSFSLDVDDGLYFIAVYTNVKSNVQGTIKPMIRYADILDDTYEPYKESVDERVTKNTSDITVSKSDIALSRTTIGYQCKNLLNLKSKVGTYTMNGLTYVINDDGSVTVNGTATANSFFYMLQKDSALGNLIYGKEVKLTGCPEGGSASTYSLRSLNVDGSSGAVADLGEGRVFTYTNTEKSASFYIAIAEGVTVTDLTFYPMLRYAEITDDTFEAYKPTLMEQIEELKARITALGG